MVLMISNISPAYAFEKYDVDVEEVVWISDEPTVGWKWDAPLIEKWGEPIVGGKRIDWLPDFLKIVFAISFIYIFGMLWLGFLIGWEKPIFKLGAEPFLLAELFKILLITFAISRIYKIRLFI